MVSPGSVSESSVMVTDRFFVFELVSDGPKVTDLVAIRKSPGFCASTYSVAVPPPWPVTTSTAKVVEDAGRKFTVTGTLTVPAPSETVAA